MSSIPKKILSNYIIFKWLKSKFTQLHVMKFLCKSDHSPRRYKRKHKWVLFIETPCTCTVLSVFYRATACNATHGIAEAFLSVCQMRMQNERNLCPHYYTAWKTIRPNFPITKMVDGGDHFYLKFFGAKRPCWSENENYQSIFARITSAVTPSEKVQLTLIRGPLCAFQWA